MPGVIPMHLRASFINRLASRTPEQFRRQAAVAESVVIASVVAFMVLATIVLVG